MTRILTNDKGLPLPLYLAIKGDTYEARGDISTTTLIDAPMARCLKKYNTYQEEASDSIWALWGQAVHAIIERVGDAFEDSKFRAEEKLMIKLPGHKYSRHIELSGTSDLIEICKDGRVILHDFKTVFVWAVTMGTSSPLYKKWIMQLNIYMYMIKECLGIQVTEIQVHAFIKDHKKSRAKRDADYPEYPVVTYNIPIYSHSSVLDFIKRRIDIHFTAEDKFKLGHQIEECSPEDRWARPEVWKMIRLGKKKSMKNFTIKDDADQENAKVYYVQKSKEYGDLTIEKIPGEDVRCVDYCPVSSHCHYFKKTYGKKEEQREDSIGTGTIVFPTDTVKELPDIEF